MGIKDSIVRIAHSYANGKLSGIELQQKIEQLINRSEKSKLLDLAIAQFTGWAQAISYPDVTHLLASMALTKREWKKIRPDLKWLNKSTIAEIDAHFKK